MDEIAGLNRSGKVVVAVSPAIYNASQRVLIIVEKIMRELESQVRASLQYAKDTVLQIQSASGYAEMAVKARKCCRDKWRQVVIVIDVVRKRGGMQAMV